MGKKNAISWSEVERTLNAPDRLAGLEAALPVRPGPDPDFDDIAALAAEQFEVPLALVTVLGPEDQWFLARVGTSDIRAPSRDSFCVRMLAASGQRPLAVGDATLHPGFSHLPGVIDAPHLRFYAGAPILMDGQAVGTVCVFDTEPRDVPPPAALERLVRLAALAASLLRLKEEARRRAQAVEVSRQEGQRHVLALDAANVASWQWDLSTGYVSGNETFYRMLGVPAARPMKARRFFTAVHAANRKVTMERLREALASGQEYDGLFQAAKTGRWLLARGRVHEWDATGRPTLFVGVNIDVTDAQLASQRTRLLLRELNHRVKNTLAMLQSLARQTLRQTSDPVEFMTAFAGRLQSLSDAHALLSDHEWGVIHLKILLHKQLYPYVTDYEKQVEIHKDEVELGPDQAVGLGLVLHELVTNARKYGSLSRAEGKVVITARVIAEDGQRVLNMTWHEIGGPPVLPPKHRGFGSILIERSLDKILGSVVHVEYLPQGLTAVVRLPLGPI
ncbi:PAS domain-containing protein [Shinella daejeonensis]|uniref:sensor histidine kinase n=1 Tax=Shinella daejeonensis TaxID=659017 RepID=UPI0020C766D3|nr:HWE histidine kinase domain-containing protein [Shinella daejeonensis]MCP8894096.1 PAS domain-containing protein [Shinella daejeonensis]